MVELNNTELLRVNGGTAPVIPAIWIAEALVAASSGSCAAAAGAVVGAVIKTVQD